MWLPELLLNDKQKWSKCVDNDDIQTLIRLAKKVSNKKDNFVTDLLIEKTFFDSSLSSQNKGIIFEWLTMYGLEILECVIPSYGKTFGELIYTVPSLNVVLETAILSKQSDPFEKHPDYGMLGCATFIENNFLGALAIKKMCPDFFRYVNDSGNNIISLAMIYAVDERFFSLFDDLPNAIFNLNHIGQTQVEYVIFELGKRLNTCDTRLQSQALKNIQRAILRFSYNINGKYSDHSPILFRIVSEDNPALFKLVCDRLIIDMNIRYAGYHLLDYVSLFMNKKILSYIANNPRFSLFTFERDKYINPRELYVNFLSVCMVTKITDARKVVDYIDFAVEHLNIDVNERNAFGNTILHVLATKFDENTEVKRILFHHLINKYNANPFSENKAGLTPLHYLYNTTHRNEFLMYAQKFNIKIV